MTARPDEDPWESWCAESKSRAEERWREVEKLSRRTMKGKDWQKEVRGRLVKLAGMGILNPHEQARVKEFKFDQLAAADRDRLKEQKLERNIYAFGIALDPAERELRPVDRYLRLNDSNRFRDVRLNLQVFIDDRRGAAIGMNIHVRGIDPARGDRSTYLRYDLDVVQMGSGPVTHFMAHWHTGDDPVGDAEDHDPRIPSLPLDPLAVLDVLVETFYPNGPRDVLPRRSPVSPAQARGIQARTEVL